ncbi:type 2 lanthipeptide synthetase LanM [Enterococcus quebecensis]|uniref:Lantibiotic biosynthesis protein n=1 Tax=Enterococcus quebecensis TaxID=903983 RepID=A0A1E5GPI4_9ENTE|nr:type 2 lanthipeptide synthetase LanM [Enterococcus quebecensis]OEG14621.1 lantibiotic biosynthesis protein [Enterococcus quebecensis]OJG73331.1 type 2 lantibiotic biosynthesis protein LanM [Enterococcus quebecensis]
MELKNLAKGTSIRQRYDVLKEYYENNHLTYSNGQLENYKKWRKRPTTVTDERFKEILQSLELTEEGFDFAIKALTSNEKEYIFKSISKEPWIKTTQQILSQEDQLTEDVFDEEKANFTYALRMHIDYFEKHLKQIITKFPRVQVQETALSIYVGEVINRCMDIGLRTFVYDLHVEKEKMLLSESVDEKEGFRQYLVSRFSSRDKLVEFFNQYPVLTRLYAETINFQLVNFQELVQAIAESEQELKQVFKIETPVSLTSLKMGAGDSHDQGKSVAILTFNNEVDVVFKPKNLMIGERFDSFVQAINKMNPAFDFYLTTKIVKENYTFEECLIYSECLSQEEVTHYYRQFGQTVALVYLLNGNDFHLENVLAFGKYPVLIDLETIIQNHFPMPDSENAIVKVMQENGESVVMSGLVPIYLFEERAEADVEGASKGIQLSALSGGEQKLPYKVLKLINFDSVNMQFMYQEHITDAAENIPLFKGEKVDFVPYIETIVDGFKEFSTFAIENKEMLATLAEKTFSDCLVRNVIKTTQSYGDLLDYSTHPTCMVDYIEREKLFENLWMHGYSNSKPVPYEIRDMLQHDVPIFFNPTSTRDLVASQGEVITNMYQEEAVVLEVAQLKNFSKKEEEEQLDYLKTSFGLYHSMDLQEKTVPLKEVLHQGDFLDGAKAVGEAIVEAAFLGEDSIAWKDIEETSPDNYVVNVMNENFYDGITGMYLYFSELYHVTGDQQFKKYYELAELLVLKLEEDYVDSISAFYGSFAAVYPLLYTYQYTGNSKLLKTAESIAAKYMEAYDKETIESYDWNGGTASIIKVFVHLYQLTIQEKYFRFAKQLLLDLDLTKITQGGFAHGYSGVIHSANSLLKIEDDPEIELLIKTCLVKERETFDPIQQGWLDLRPNPPMVNDLWCYGSTGIGLAYLDLYVSGFEDVHLAKEIQIVAERLINQEKRDDCLCHGNFGDLEFLIEYGKTTLATDEQKEQIQRKIHQSNQKVRKERYTFEGLPTIPKYGLFTGLAGIGHQLLRVHDSTQTADLLTLELLKN